MTHLLIFLSDLFFSFKCYEPLVLYIILLEVTHNLSHFCKLARGSK